MALEQEIATYRRELPRLLAEGQEGRFVLIRGNQVAGVWNTFDDACQAGHAQFGLEPFLAQPVDARDLTNPFPEDPDARVAG